MQDITNVIIYTCTFPAMTSENASCEKRLLGTDQVTSAYVFFYWSDKHNSGISHIFLMADYEMHT